MKGAKGGRSEGVKRRGGCKTEGGSKGKEGERKEGIRSKRFQNYLGDRIREMRRLMERWKEVASRLLLFSRKESDAYWKFRFA